MCNKVCKFAYKARRALGTWMGADMKQQYKRSERQSRRKAHFVQHFKHLKSHKRKYSELLYYWEYLEEKVVRGWSLIIGRSVCVWGGHIKWEGE